MRWPRLVLPPEMGQKIKELAWHAGVEPLIVVDTIGVLSKLNLQLKILFRIFLNMCTFSFGLELSTNYV